MNIFKAYRKKLQKVKGRFCKHCLLKFDLSCLLWKYMIELAMGERSTLQHRSTVSKDKISSACHFEKYHKEMHFSLVFNIESM